MFHVVVILNCIMLPYLRLFVVFVEHACVVYYFVGLVQVVVYFSVVVFSCVVCVLCSSMFFCGKTSVCLCISGVLSESVMSVSELLGAQCKGTESCVSLLSSSFSIVCFESLSKSEIVKGHVC